MGWWNIGVGESKREMFNGDTPADIMGDAIEKIVKAYEDAWNRKPYRKEMEAVFKFTSSLPEYYTEVGDDDTEILNEVLGMVDGNATVDWIGNNPAEEFREIGKFIRDKRVKEEVDDE